MIEVSMPMFVMLISAMGIGLGFLGYRIGRHRNNDPLQPHPSEFSSWKDFVDRVAKRLVEANGDAVEEREAMKLYQQASPYFICVSMLMMENRIRD